MNIAAKIVAQKDYVRRGKSGSSRRKKGKTQAKNGVSASMMAVAVLVLVAFIGGLFFLTRHNKAAKPAPASHNATGNSLPPEPEERWRYIKELENRKPGVVIPNKPAANSTDNPRQLTDEQRQLLEQIQADMHKQPTELNEVPWNGQATDERSATSPRPQAAPPAPAKTPPDTTKRWMVQCGSFKSTEQAQAVRAELAFAGFDTRIAASEGWQRVVMGPFISRKQVDDVLSQLKAAGRDNCIPLMTEG